MRESNPRHRLKRPLHYHYANQAWKWWDLNPHLLYAKQIFLPVKLHSQACSIVYYN